MEVYGTMANGSKVNLFGTASSFSVTHFTTTLNVLH